MGRTATDYERDRRSGLALGSASYLSVEAGKNVLDLDFFAVKRYCRRQTTRLKPLNGLN